MENTEKFNNLKKLKDSSIMELPQSSAANTSKSCCEAVAWADGNQHPQENKLSGATSLEDAAELIITERHKDSAVMEPLQALDADEPKPNCEAAAGAGGDQQLSETITRPEGLLQEKVGPKNRAESEVHESVTDAPAVELTSSSAVADKWASTTSDQSKQHLAFVCDVTFMVLKDCGAIGPHTDTKQEWEAPVGCLAAQTMNGLRISSKFCPDKKLVKKVSKEVLKDLKKTFSREQLESVLVMQDPAMEIAIVKSIKSHMIEIAPRHQKRKKYLGMLKSTLKVFIFLSSFSVALVVIAIVFF